MPFNCNFYCGYFDIYHSGLAQPALFFVTVYIVKISTVHSGTIKQIDLKTNQRNTVHVLLSGYILKNSDRNQSYIPIPIYNLKMSKVHSGTIKLRPLK